MLRISFFRKKKEEWGFVSLVCRSRLGLFVGRLVLLCLGCLLVVARRLFVACFVFVVLSQLRRVVSLGNRIVVQQMLVRQILQGNFS